MPGDSRDALRAARLTPSALKGVEVSLKREDLEAKLTVEMLNDARLNFESRPVPMVCSPNNTIRASPTAAPSAFRVAGAPKASGWAFAAKLLMPFRSSMRERPYRATSGTQPSARRTQ